MHGCLALLLRLHGRSARVHQPLCWLTAWAVLELSTADYITAVFWGLGSPMLLQYQPVFLLAQQGASLCRQKIDVSEHVRDWRPHVNRSGGLPCAQLTFGALMRLPRDSVEYRGETCVLLTESAASPCWPCMAAAVCCAVLLTGCACQASMCHVCIKDHDSWCLAI